MNKQLGIHVGGSSILMIFVLLCLVTFSALSLVSANADYKLTAKAAQSVTRYYQADAQAETRLAFIDQTLKSVSESMPDDAEASVFHSRISDALMHEDEVTAGIQDGRFIIQYQVDIDGRRALQVALEPVYPLQNAKERYVLTAWQVIQTAEWEPDDTLTVWDGEEPLSLWSGK